MVIENTIKNTYYRINRKKIEDFSVMNKKYANDYIGVLHANCINKTCFQILNVRTEGSKYITELVYKKNDKKEENLIFQDKLICSVTKKDNIIYVECIDLLTEKVDNYSIG